jgi:two-component system, cell cycle response regulator
MSQRVLLVDDSPQMHRLVAAWLRCDNVEVISAHNGAEGESLAASNDIDAILLDVDMPDVSGFDLCRRLKSEPHCASVPIIFLTGASSPEDRVRGLNLGATDYVIKPFHPAEFQARVRAALRTKQLLDLLQERAQIDGLTALRNRAFLDDRLGAELAALARRPAPLGAIMIDVDNFKNVNDTLGHTAGDEVLRAVAAVLLEQTRTEDVVARYGGEEFAVLTPGVGCEGTFQLAERLRRTIETLETRTVAGPVRVTCSFGVAYFDPAAPGSLLLHADAALYAAKRHGKNCVLTYTPQMQQRAA